MYPGPRASRAAAVALTVGLVVAPFVPAATADSNPLDLAGRFGCDDGGNFVEVTIGNPAPGASYQVGTLPSGQTAPAPGPSAGAVPDVLTAPEAHRITVRLAQPIAPGGDAYVKVVATGEVHVVVLPHTCKRAEPRVPQLPSPVVAARLASGRDCTARPVQANKVAIVTSVNVSRGPTKKYRSASGLKAVFYNLALVDIGASRVVDSKAVSFTDPAAGTSCLAAPRGPGTYQVQAIGTDGSTTATNLVRVPAGTPGPGGTQPTPTPKPPEPTPPHGPTATPTPPPGRTGGPNAGSGLSGGSASGPALTGVPPQGVPGPGGGGGGAGAGGAASSAGRPQQRAPAAGHAAGGAGSATPEPVPAPTTSGIDALRRLAEPPVDAISTIFVWQAWAALVVLGFAAATGAMIMITVRRAGRR